jgi:hypothetical protein
MVLHSYFYENSTLEPKIFKMQSHLIYLLVAVLLVQSWAFLTKPYAVSPYRLSKVRAVDEIGSGI